jgi:hypothetical protein
MAFTKTYGMIKHICLNNLQENKPNMGAEKWNMVQQEKLKSMIALQKTFQDFRRLLENHGSDSVNRETLRENAYYRCTMVVYINQPYLVISE